MFKAQAHQKIIQRMQQRKKKLRKLALLISIFTLFFLITSCKNQSDDNIAKVNQTFITKSEFESQLSFYSRFLTEKNGEDYLSKKDNHGEMNLKKLENDILNSLILEVIMLDDLEKNNIEISKNDINELENEQISALYGEDSLKANLNAFDSSLEEYENILYYDSIRERHKKFVLDNMKISDKEVINKFKSEKNLQAQYKYTAFKFDDLNEAKKVYSKLKNSKDFLDYKDRILKNFDIVTSDYVYSDDEILKKSDMILEDRISKIFEFNSKYYILMIEDKNTDTIVLLNKAKEKISEEKYNEYLKKLFRSSKIKIYG
ncbi:MAG: SurA N-terminal domain-containing protein [Peptoniphilaceae bacterium]|nr:SurA N-terminal domain-containing protein [Peptoniphilaceae bacterium]